MVPDRLLVLIRTVRDISIASLASAREINRASPYPIGSPHSRAEIEMWSTRAIDASFDPTLIDQSDPEGTITKYAMSSKLAYTFVDRAISRGQGLLQFNSIVFAGIALIIQNNVGFIYKALISFSLLAISLSTAFCLICMWVVWFSPDIHLDPKQEAIHTWRSWLNRSLLLNVSILLSGMSFLAVALLMLIKTILS